MGIMEGRARALGLEVALEMRQTAREVVREVPEAQELITAFRGGQVRAPVQVQVQGRVQEELQL
jgi:hypothetical protein